MKFYYSNHITFDDDELEMIVNRVKEGEDFDEVYNELCKNYEEESFYLTQLVHDEVYHYVLCELDPTRESDKTFEYTIDFNVSDCDLNHLKTEVKKGKDFFKVYNQVSNWWPDKFYIDKTRLGIQIKEYIDSKIKEEKNVKDI